MTDARRWFDAALADTTTELSPAGHRRRQAMGAQLQQAVARRRQRRHTRRAAVGVALLLIVVWLGSSLGSPRRPGPHPNQVTENRPPSLQHMEFAEVHDLNDVLARYCAPSAPPRAATLIDDEELLRLLVAANRPTGLIRTADRVFLTAKVTDDLPLAEDG